MNTQFIKIIQGYNQDEFEILCQHSKDVWESLKQSEFITPRVLDASDLVIYYEYIELPERVDLVWKKKLSLDIEKFKKIGSMLALIHTGPVPHLLHGDYVLHNIFSNPLGEICLVDCHPPEVIGYDKSYLYGDGSAEMYLFMLNLSSSFGIKLSWFNVEIVRKAMQNFRRGYGPVGGVSSLLKAVFRFYTIRRASGFSVLNSSLHTLTGLFFIGVSNG